MGNEERIKADAVQADTKNQNASYQYRTGFRDGYIAGATAENSRAKVLADALEAIAGITMPVPNKADMIEIAKKHLEQWRGKEVDRPCPHCGKELTRDRNLCCRECGKEVKG